MENQRRSFRLDVEVGFEAKLISEAAMKSGIAKLKHRPDWNATLPSVLGEVDIALNNLLDELARTAPKAAGAISLLNQKVDLIRLGQHWSERVKELPMRRINLSATGLAFDYKESLEKGQVMECTLTLPTLAWTMTLYARVITIREEATGHYKICLDFEFIRDEDREQLIRFNLLRQQQLLAEEKLS